MVPASALIDNTVIIRKFNQHFYQIKAHSSLHSMGVTKVFEVVMSGICMCGAYYMHLGSLVITWVVWD